jgi:hypothetical protein
MRAASINFSPYSTASNSAHALMAKLKNPSASSYLLRYSSEGGEGRQTVRRGEGSWRMHVSQHMSTG